MVNIGGLSLSLYALSIWIGCLAGAALFLYESRNLRKAAVWGTLVLGTVLGLLCARAYYMLARFDLFNEIGWDHFFRAEDEELKYWGAANGAAFWGAVGGVCLAALIAARVSGEKVSALLDALAPSAALAIGLSRFGEYGIGEGIGPDVEAESLFFFPLAVANKWEEWKFAVFMLEGVVALVIFALLMTRGRRLKDGYRARMFLILYSSCQIVLEALRRDNFLRWLFVRVSQLASAAVLAGILVVGLIRWARKHGTRGAGGRLTGKTLLNLVKMLFSYFALLILYWLVILGRPLVEEGETLALSTLWYELITSAWPLTLLILVGLLCATVFRKPGKDGMTENQAAWLTASFFFSIVIIIALEFGIDKSADMPVSLGYLSEAVCCGIMGRTTWQIAMKH